MDTVEAAFEVGLETVVVVVVVVDTEDEAIVVDVASVVVAVEGFVGGHVLP